MRIAVLLCLLPGGAWAWTFTPDPVCTITHTEGPASLTVTYDASRPQPYALDLITDAPLPSAPVFALDFGGFAISTTRHTLSDGNRRLTVTDHGFGNVLAGLAAGTGARALIGQTVVPFPTDDAAPAIQAFRNCSEASLSRPSSPSGRSPRRLAGSASRPDVLPYGPKAP